MTAQGRYLLETMAEHDRRRARERFMAKVRASLWFVVTHCIAFGMGAFSVYEVYAPKLASRPVIYVEHMQPPQPAAARLSYQCTKQEVAEHIEVCKVRRRMEKVGLK